MQETLRIRNDAFPNQIEFLIKQHRFHNNIRQKWLSSSNQAPLSNHEKIGNPLNLPFIPVSLSLLNLLWIKNSIK